MPNPTQSEPPVDALPTVRPADLTKSGYPNGRSSVGKRALIALVRFLIIFCIGVSAILVWQSYGDPVREIVASSYPQFGWLAPQAERVSQNAPASSPDHQQPDAISVDLDAVRQDIDRIAINIASGQEQMTSSANQIATSQQQIARSVERIATSQEQMMHSVEQMTRSLDQFTADQEQTTREIVKLEQSILSKNPEISSRPASASPPKPVSRPASASKPKPVSRASPESTRP
jgi:peptidoglycan hydrolase CwlO-like protein